MIKFRKGEAFKVSSVKISLQQWLLTVTNKLQKQRLTQIGDPFLYWNVDRKWQKCCFLTVDTSWSCNFLFDSCFVHYSLCNIVSIYNKIPPLMNQEVSLMEEMQCLFHMKWYTYVKNHPHHLSMSYVMLSCMCFDLVSSSVCTAVISIYTVNTCQRWLVELNVWSLKSWNIENFSEMKI